jgi:hypothetical protein
MDVKVLIAAGRQSLTPVILATWQAEIRRITVQSQPGQIVCEIPMVQSQPGQIVCEIPSPK